MRTSILHNETAVRNAVDNSSSIREALEALGLRAAGGNYKALRESCVRFGISVPLSTGDNKTLAARKANKFPDEEIFVVDSTYKNRRNLKKRLIDSGVPNSCAICGIEPFWNNAPLTLQLDHINGVWNDNRRENLRLICPNCHSQTDTFCGANR